MLQLVRGQMHTHTHTRTLSLSRTIYILAARVLGQKLNLSAIGQLSGGSIHMLGPQELRAAFDATRVGTQSNEPRTCPCGCVGGRAQAAQQTRVQGIQTKKTVYVCTQSKYTRTYKHVCIVHVYMQIPRASEVIFTSRTLGASSASDLTEGNEW